MTVDKTLYYICEDRVRDCGVFGTMDECAKWYLDKIGVTYRVLQVQGERCSEDATPPAGEARAHEGRESEWLVVLENWGEYPPRKKPSVVLDGCLKVAATNKEEALAGALEQFLDRVVWLDDDFDNDYQLVGAESGLIDLVGELGDILQVYEAAQQPPTDDCDRIMNWFYRTKHTKATFQVMVDIVSGYPESPLSRRNAERLRAQIAAP